MIIIYYANNAANVHTELHMQNSTQIRSPVEDTENENFLKLFKYVLKTLSTYLKFYNLSFKYVHITVSTYL